MEKKFDAQLELSKCKLIRIEAKSILTIETENRKMIGKLRIAMKLIENNARNDDMQNEWAIRNKNKGNFNIRCTVILE